MSHSCFVCVAAFGALEAEVEVECSQKVTGVMAAVGLQAGTGKPILYGVT